MESAAASRPNASKNKIDPFKYLRSVQIVQRAVRTLLRQNAERRLDRLRAQCIERGLAYDKLCTYQDKFIIERARRGIVQLEKIFLRVVIKVTGDKTSLLVEGYDLNPNKKLKYQVDK